MAKIDATESMNEATNHRGRSGTGRSKTATATTIATTAESAAITPCTIIWANSSRLGCTGVVRSRRRMPNCR